MRRLLLALLLSVVGSMSFAQLPPAPEAKPDDAEEIVREQSIYIPYSKLRGVFEKDGRGVFLPYEKFQELWKKAQQATEKEPDVKPPVGALIAAIESEAAVEADVVSVTAKLTIELLAEGWHEVPLRLADAAIRSAKLGDQPARILVKNNQHVLLVKKEDKKDKGPATVELTLEYAKAFTKAPGQNSVQFQAPAAPVNRWRIRVPEAGVKVNIQPLLAATEPPGAKAEDAKETVVLAFVGAAPSVRIDWTPKVVGAAGLAALIDVQSEQEVSLDQGVVKTRARLAYKISRSEVNKLEVEVPAGKAGQEIKVVSVFDANVRTWDVKKAEDGLTQKITVQLHEPAKVSQHLTIDLEEYRGEMMHDTVRVPTVRALDAGRQQGLVVVQVSPTLRAEATERTGLSQVDFSELPDSLKNRKWDFAYRFAALSKDVSFNLSLSVEKVLPRVRTDELVETFLEPDKLTVNLMVVYEVERVGIFKLELDVPEGFDVRQVEGRALPGVQAAAKDTHHLEGEKKTRLVVNLASQALGKVALFVELEKRLSDENLQTPTGKKSELKLPLPRVVPETVERATGRYVVFAPESLLISPAKTDGLRQIPLQEAYTNVTTCRAGRFTTTREMFAFAYTRDPASLSLEVERRKPHVTARQMLRVQIESGNIYYTANFHYDIRYSGVKELWLEVPKDIEKINLETAGIVKTVVAPEAKGDGKDKEKTPAVETWKLTGDGEFKDSQVIKLTWQTKTGELAVGKSATIEIPVLKPVKVDRAWGQIVLAKAEGLDVQPLPETTGLRPIDPQHDLQPGIDASDAARAFEFQADWSLAVSATRYKLEQVKSTSLEHAVVRMVYTLSRQVSVQALYRLRSAEQRLAVKLPDGAKIDSAALRINGRPSDLEQGDGGVRFIPLVAQKTDEPSVIEIRYRLEDASQRFELPEFPNDPAVQKVDLSIYLPEEQVLLGSLGPWVRERSGEWFDDARFGPGNDQQLVNQLVAGVPMTATPTFQTDGRLYSFSTLRPEAGSAGSLRLVTLHQNWLRFWLFAGVLAGGVFLLRYPAPIRFASVAGFVVALVLLGVFTPTFASRVVNWVLFVAIGLVFVIWLATWVVRERPTFRWPVRQPAAPPSSAGGST